MTLETYLTWFKVHERALIIGVILATSAWGYTRWLDKSATDAKLNAAVAAQVAQQADASKKQADAAQAQVIAQVNAQTALLMTQVASDKQTIASLVTAIASRDAATSNKIGQVSGTKTPPQAVADLSSAYQLKQPIVPTDTGAQVSTEDLQQFTVAKIEGDAAKADLADTQKELSAAQNEVTADEGIIVDKDKVIAQDIATLAAHDADAKANAVKSADELKSAKDAARKSKWKWFWVGFASGWVGHTVVQAKTGL